MKGALGGMEWVEKGGDRLLYFHCCFAQDEGMSIMCHLA